MIVVPSIFINESIEDLVKEMQKIARDAITEQLKQREDVQLDTLFDCLSAVAQDKMDFYRVIFTESKLLRIFSRWRSCDQILHFGVQL